MSNIIDSIQLSGVTYTIQGSGGGKAIEAGRGISVTTGETADTVSFNLPISAGTGTNSIAEGDGTFATGGQSHAEGDGTIANGISSHAEGAITTASGNCSHAEGYNTTAIGENSHAEGNNAQARGNDSHAEGNQTIANGNCSHAEGNGTIAYNDSEHASGQHNVSSKASTTFGDSGNTLFSVGNGTAYNARHNAFEIRQNGDIYITSGGTDIKLQDNLGGGGGNPTVELTQAEYDALVTAGTVSPTTYYIITDAQAGDLSQYWTSAQTNSAITQATSGKVDTSTYNTYTAATDTALANKQTTLTAGTGIDITDNVISATGGGGGGKAVSGGTNISITTGETADTINCTVPASASSGNYSIMFGQPTSSSDASGAKTITGGQWSKATAEGAVSIGQMNQSSGQWAWAIGNNNKSNGKASFACGNFTSANGNYAFSEGTNTTANTEASHSAGSYTSTKNRSEFSIGEYNNSVSASTTFGNSGNTLFSVGNGTSSSARHNAFEIRQNGDIYLTKDGQDVKLQDQLGGSSITVDTALDSGSTNPVENRVIYNKIDEVEQVTAAGLNAVNSALGGLKLQQITQSAYDALTTKDPSTLYIIVN